MTLQLEFDFFSPEIQCFALYLHSIHPLNPVCGLEPVRISSDGESVTFLRSLFTLKSSCLRHRIVYIKPLLISHDIKNITVDYIILYTKLSYVPG